MDRATFAAFTVMNSKLNRILNLLGDEVMPELDQLAEQISRIEVVANAIVAKLEGAGVDPAQVQALVDRLKAVGDKLEAAAA